MSEITKGKRVLVYDRYRFAKPLRAYVTAKSESNDGICVTLLESNNHKYPIGEEVWVHECQLKPESITIADAPTLDILQRIAIYKKASKKWGAQSQLIVALEELSELQVEIAKQLNGKREGIKELIDELADARIMIEQVELNFNCMGDVENRMSEKVLRLNSILGKPHPQDNLKRDN